MTQSPNVVHAIVAEFLKDPTLIMVCLCWTAVFYAIYIQFRDFQNNLLLELEHRALREHFEHEENKLIETTAICNDMTRSFNAEIVELKEILEATPDTVVPEETSVENSDANATEDSVLEEDAVMEEDSVDATTEVSVSEEAIVENPDVASTEVSVDTTEENEVIPNALPGYFGQACSGFIPDATKAEPTPADLPRKNSISDFVFIEYQKCH